ncbi:MAG: alpha/beta hydrolase family protein [Bacteroidota bacterium]|nr:alpha/beta hydrolase family protein [Bacteroidota bacterium]
MKRLCTLLVLMFAVVVVFAAKIETVSTYSKVMNKEIKAVVVTPDNYSTAKRLPVIYLLHGYGGNYNDWITQGKSFIPLVDTYDVIVVCPDGAIGSWYFDSPMDKNFQYETYVTKELIPFVDSHYATIADRAGRGITGLSMGGHGALYLSFRHQDLFGVAGSMSGGVDFRPFPNNWEIAKRLGTYAENPDNWEKNTVVNLVHLLTPKSLTLIIDCGSEDFFYKVNCQLHEKLLDRNIPHDFIIRPGAHNWPYWNNSIQYQMLFMSNFFTKTTPVK